VLKDGFKEKGLCNSSQYDPELWWPNGTTGDEELKALDAINICNQCPVEIECHMYAVAEKQYYGIWGGTTEEERREDRRRHRRILAEQVDRLAQVQVA